MEPITYANGSTLEDPAISYGIVFSNFMSKGVFTFQGGTDRLIRLMHEELVRAGVDVRIRSRRRAHRGSQRPRDGRRGRRPHDRVLGRRFELQPQVDDFQSRRRGALRSQIRRRRPGRAAQQFELPGLHGAEAGRRARRKPGRPAVQFHGAGLPDRLAAEPRHHQPHLFVLLPAHPAGQQSLADRVEHQRQLSRLGRSVARGLRGQQARSGRNHDRGPVEIRPARFATSSTMPKPRPRSPSATTRSTSKEPVSAPSSRGWPSAAPCPSR